MHLVTLIASSSPDTAARWASGLQGLATVLVVSQVDSLKEVLAREMPRVLLLDLDLPSLEGPKGVARLRQSNPTTNIVALIDAASDETELALFMAGVRGCCRRDIDPQLLKRVVLAIQQGELWIRRTLTPRLLDALSARLADGPRTEHTIVGSLADLTRREQEIAALIGNGESNKQIARRLAITERTVKAHLTEIFRKLGVGCRLRLALLVTRRPERLPAPLARPRPRIPG